MEAQQAHARSIDRLSLHNEMIKPMLIMYATRGYETFIRDHLSLLPSGTQPNKSQIYELDDFVHGGNVQADALTALEADLSRKSTYVLVFELWYAVSLDDFGAFNTRGT